MKIEHLNVTRLIKLFIAGSRWMSKYADILNDLNVYPVPDGDTGTNMSMTMQAVENELVKLNHEPTMHEFCELLSEAILLGARGNSGTILSQIVQGFLNGFEDKEELNIDDITRSFEEASKLAYKAVSNPVEGTMLTVIRVIAEKAKEYDGPKDNFIPYLSYVKEAAHQAVEETPNQLLKLKEAGVVDAGGMGVFYLIEGFEKSITDPEMLKDLERIVKSQAHRKERLEATNIEVDIEFKYCTEFIVQAGKFNIEELKEEIKGMGDSMVVAQSSTKTKTHIHTNNPGAVLEIAMKYGGLDNIKIDNMELQHRSLHLAEGDLMDQNSAHVMVQNENTEKKAYFVIADTYEMGELFIKSGATCVLIGGQGQNPSVADMEMAIAKIDAEDIVLLPNNKNIISAAKIVAERASKNVEVYETKTMLEGNFYVKNKSENLEQVVKDARRNKSIEITKAVRDTKVGDLIINEGNYIALVNGKIMYENKNLTDLISDLYEENIDDNTLNIFAVLGNESTDEGNRAILNTKGIKHEEYIGKQDNYHYYLYIENKDPNQPEIAIITDSTSDLSPALIGDLSVNIIPLKIKFDGNKYYKDGVDISKTDFWHKIITEGVVPKTSQPSPAEFKNLYQRLLKRGYKKIITILISSKLSGTQQAAKVARGMLPEEKDIAIIDSKNVWLGSGHLVLEAAKMAKAGESFETIIENVEEMRNKGKIYFVVDELKYLERGGRIGKASAKIGGVLNIKPILKVEDGEVHNEKKAIGDKGAMKYMEKLLKQEAKNGSIVLYTGWGGTKHQSENADELRKSVEKFDNVDYQSRCEVGSTIGSHSGPLYGMAIYPKIK
ncbi:DegV family EDD domain-containing protein [Psychrilyobacter atlanticus]|uniref:DegV family EDD domain-containing protein n=1 Tax=Psychrilyobacter atlanticus TaxID=271091 RepID=UPI000415F356|nr:DegV family EDD domain-containing protein [Psychrilyobacter atlanticus]